MILANRVPVAEDELLDYLIEGVMDVRLRNQARLMRFRSRVEMLEAFESVVFGREDGRTGLAGRTGWRGGSAGSVAGGESSRSRGVERTSTVGGTGQVRARCFRCGESGHVAARCERPPTGRACYSCGATGHLAARCPGRERPMGAGPLAGSAEIALTGASRSVALPEPYVLNVNISAADYSYVGGAVVDSGSPISIIKSSSVPSELCLPAEEDVGRFYGINGSLLRINSIFIVK